MKTPETQRMTGVVVKSNEKNSYYCISTTKQQLFQVKNCRDSAIDRTHKPAGNGIVGGQH